VVSIFIRKERKKSFATLNAIINGGKEESLNNTLLSREIALNAGEHTSHEQTRLNFAQGHVVLHGIRILNKEGKDTPEE